MKKEYDSAGIPDENGHSWINYKDMICCKFCGIIRKKDGTNKPCPGKVKVTFR